MLNDRLEIQIPSKLSEIAVPALISRDLPNLVSFERPEHALRSPAGIQTGAVVYTAPPTCPAAERARKAPWPEEE